MDHLSTLFSCIIIIFSDGDGFRKIVYETLANITMLSDNTNVKSNIIAELSPIYSFLVDSLIRLTLYVVIYRCLYYIKVYNRKKFKQRTQFYPRSISSYRLVSDADKSRLQYFNRNGSNQRSCECSENSARSGCCCMKPRRSEQHQACINKEAAHVYRNQPMQYSNAPSGMLFQPQYGQYQSQQCPQRQQLCQQPQQMYNQVQPGQPMFKSPVQRSSMPCECLQQSGQPYQYPPGQYRNSKEMTHSIENIPPQTPVDRTSQAPSIAQSYSPKDLSLPTPENSMRQSASDRSPPKQFQLDNRQPQRMEQDFILYSNPPVQPKEQIVYMDVSQMEKAPLTDHIKPPPAPTLYKPQSDEISQQPQNIYPFLPPIPESQHPEINYAPIRPQQQSMYQSSPPIQPNQPPQNQRNPPIQPQPQQTRQSYPSIVQPKGKNSIPTQSTQPVQTYGGSSITSDNAEQTAPARGCCMKPKKSSGPIHPQIHGYKVDSHLRIRGKVHQETISIPEDSYLITK